MEYAEFGGLCDKLMIVHPGKFCSAHFHWRKTEYYEVVLGEMDLFYAPEIIDFPDLGVVGADVIQTKPMPKGAAVARRHRAARGPRGRVEPADLVPALKQGRPQVPDAAQAPARFRLSLLMPARRSSSARTPATATSPPRPERPGCCPSGSTSTTTTSLPSSPTPDASPTTSAKHERDGIADARPAARRCARSTPATTRGHRA